MGTEVVDYLFAPHTRGDVLLYGEVRFSEVPVGGRSEVSRFDVSGFTVRLFREQ